MRNGIQKESPTVAILSSKGEYSFFKVGDKTISFLTGMNLDRYTRIKEWDNGYIVVMCKTKSNPEVEEEDYIDLQPILQNLYFDPDRFLESVKEVRIEYV